MHLGTIDTNNSNSDVQVQVMSVEPAASTFFLELQWL